MQSSSITNLVLHWISHTKTKKKKKRTNFLKWIIGSQLEQCLCDELTMMKNNSLSDLITWWISVKNFLKLEFVSFSTIKIVFYDD